MVVFGKDVTKVIGLPLDNLVACGKGIADDEFPEIDY